MRKLGLFRGPEAHSAQSMECRCLSQFRTQQPKSGARWPRTPFRVCPHWSQLRSSMGQGPRMSSCLCLSLHLPGFRGKAAAIVQGQPSGICTPPCLLTRRKREPILLLRVVRSRKDKAVTHLARAAHAFRKITELNQEVGAEPTATAPALYSQQFASTFQQGRFGSQSPLHPFLPVRCEAVSSDVKWG